ncbi:bZIP_ATF6 domain-containing protein ATf6 isoform 2-T2 [Cochliomyia hominivorax]
MIVLQLRTEYEIASFMPQPGDYSLDDLEEIIRSTDSQLDASLDINAFANTFNQNDFDMAVTDPNVFSLTDKPNVEQIPAVLQSQQENQLQQPTVDDNECHFNFSAFPSPATSQQSAGYSSPNETPGRTSSPSSLDGDQFNPDDFINFLNDGDAKIDDLTHDTIMKLNENCRNTPSPTGSCTSSSGSSTSGIQSDASSVVSMPQNYNFTMKQEHDDDLLEFIKFKNEKSERDIKMNETTQQSPPLAQQFDNNISTNPDIVKDDEMASTTTTTATTTLLPITLPVLPVTTIQTVPPVNFVQGATLIPVQTVPLTTVKPVVNIKAPTAIKIENKSLPANKNVATAPANLVKTATNGSNSVNSGSIKVTPPPNAKPKTIFLSSNDFKALMQKMNKNGKNITGVNGQMPKIIMKTANGKVIAANKLTSNTSTNSSSSSASISNASVTTTVSPSPNTQSLQFVSKMVKASGPMMVKQQPSKVVTTNARSAAAMAAAARATLSHTKISGRSDFSMLKGLNDDKLLKKQLRMLKNRESASLSRKKKKEYVEKLENRISDLEKENYSLKGENSSLRSQLMAFAQTCKCKHGNVSEFILNTLNMDCKNGGAVLNAIDRSYLMNNAKQHLDNCGNASNNTCGNTTTTTTTTTTSTTHHVKIAPKPANSSTFINKDFKQKMNATTIKKNVAILFAMAFMVTLNIGNFQNYLNKTALENAIETTVTSGSDEPAVQTGRRLLWVPNEDEFHEQTNRSKRETEMANMPPPPLHFLRPINRTTADKINGTSAKDEPPIKRSSTIGATTTATYANATQENMRLARNLHKWIGGNDYLNLTGNGIGNDFEHMEHFKFGSGSYMDYDLPLQAPIGSKQKRKIFLEPETQQKHAKFNNEGERNSLDLFKPRISEEYLRLFRGIKRQDDTFYVLSFNMDHILLPASVYNKSSRPKMSLMLPAGDPSHNGDIVLMQIDCEVINTTELEIKSHMIPEKLRPTKYSSNVRVNPNDVANNETAGPASATATKSNNIPLKREETKEKPSAPRTYFMMGPKNQVSPNSTTTSAGGANDVKRKPTIVKLNANDSVIGSGVLNVRNSTLFTRMRDTVGSQNNGFLAATDVKKLI